MIRLPAPAELTPAERYALNLLVDLSRLLPVDDATADVVRLELVDTPEDVPVRDCVAWKWGLAPGDGVVQLPRSSNVTPASDDRPSSSVVSTRGRSSQTK